MNRFLLAATAACFLTVSALAQTPASGPASGNDGHVSLSSGATLPAELTKSIDAKKTKVGDEVSARITQDLKTAEGTVVMHKGSKLVGHVTEVQAKTKEIAESRLGLVFEKVVAKDGQEITFNGVIQALAPPAQVAPSMGDDRGGMGAGSGRSGGAMSPMGGGGMGAPGSSTMGSNVGNTTGSISPANGSNTGGVLNAASRGVSGMPGVALNSAASGNVQSSVLSSTNGNIKLDNGTQLILQVTGPAAAK